jgi:hypothetical protein
MDLKVTLNKKIVDVSLPKLAEYNGSFELKIPLLEKELTKWNNQIDIPFSSINKAGVFYGCMPSEDGTEIFSDFVEFDL